MKIDEKLKALPDRPGVYRFMDRENRIIYIGKSKHLRNRVRSYFRGVKTGKIHRLVREIQDLDYELCDTHLEARLLECLRIKEHKPQYNAQFKREKGFVYLKIGQRYPQSALSVAAHPDGGIGPFRSQRLLESVIEVLRKLYPIIITDLPREAGDAGEPVGGSEISFEYAVLPRRLTAAEYIQNQAALAILFQEAAVWPDFIQGLTGAMLEAAAGERFQEAIFFRDLLEALTLLHRLWVEDQQLFQELLFLRIPLAEGVKYFRVRAGRIEDSAVGQGMDGSEFTEFIQHSEDRGIFIGQALSERAQLDFRDILYSEIRALPPDQVVRSRSQEISHDKDMGIMGTDLPD